MSGVDSPLFVLLSLVSQDFRKSPVSPNLSADKCSKGSLTGNTRRGASSVEQPSPIPDGGMLNPGSSNVKTRLRAVSSIVLAATAFGLLSLVGVVKSPPAQAYDPATDESRLLDYTNKQRQAAGLAPLKVWPSAALLARQHSAEMAAQNSLFHSADWTRVDPIWTKAAQNVGMAAGIFGDPAVQLIQCGSPTACDPLPSPVPPCPWQSAPPGSEGRAFLTSKPHCENVMNPDFNFVGIGIVYGYDGTVWFTVDFFAIPAPPPGLEFPGSPPASESPAIQLPSIEPRSTELYFAEGYTGAGFDTLYEIFNPSDKDANVSVTFFTPTGSVTKSFSLGAKSSKTIDASEVVGRGVDVGAKVSSNKPIVAERRMLFNYRLSGVDGSTQSAGLPAPRLSFLFPEGYTGPGFEQWLTLANPNGAQADLKITFMKPDGATHVHYMSVPGGTRRTLEVGPVIGPTEVSTKVESLNGVSFLAERPMYFNYSSLYGLGTFSGGHVGVGIDEPGTHFYLAEGYTGPGFEEWITIQNPDPYSPANVIIRYLLDTGGAVDVPVSVGPHSRFTRFANSDVPGHSIAVEIFSDRPVATERPMYFDYIGWRDGHNGAGMNGASKYWAVANVDTRLFADTWITIGNPNPSAATVTLYFYYPDGGPPFIRNFGVPANGRGSFKANTIAPQGEKLGLIVASDKAVTVEKPLYQWAPGGVGGDVAPGVPLV